MRPCTAAVWAYAPAANSMMKIAGRGRRESVKDMASPSLRRRPGPGADRSRRARLAVHRFGVGLLHLVGEGFDHVGDLRLDVRNDFRILGRDIIAFVGIQLQIVELRT